jgi:hypothetical protein
VQEILQDNGDEEYSKFGVFEDCCHRSDSNIHPNDDGDREVCDCGNDTCAAGGNTNSVLSDDWKQLRRAMIFVMQNGFKTGHPYSASIQL